MINAAHNKSTLPALKHYVLQHRSVAVDVFELEDSIIPEQAFWDELRDDCKQRWHQTCCKAHIQIWHSRAVKSQPSTTRAASCSGHWDGSLSESQAVIGFETSAVVAISSLYVKGSRENCATLGQHNSVFRNSAYKPRVQRKRYLISYKNAKGSLNTSVNYNVTHVLLVGNTMDWQDSG